MHVGSLVVISSDGNTRLGKVVDIASLGFHAFVIGDESDTYSSLAGDIDGIGNVVVGDGEHADVQSLFGIVDHVGQHIFILTAREEHGMLLLWLQREETADVRGHGLFAAEEELFVSGD